MAWSCNGRLFSPTHQVDNRVSLFLDTVVNHINTYQVDIMWLSDAHFLKGEIDRYLPQLKASLPDARVIQFPTVRVHTSARCDTHNRMGAALAIITYKWKGFLTSTYTDPIGLGIVNALHFKVDGLSFSSINTYCLPTTHGDGPATLYARIKRFTELGTTSPRLRHLPPDRVVYTLVQKLVTKAKLENRLAFIIGDFNAPIPTLPDHSTLSHWMTTNQLTSPSHDAFSTDSTYFTRSSRNGYRNTIIDHTMQTQLPTQMWTQQVGTANNYETEVASDHLPIWIRYAISSYIPRVPVSRPLTTKMRSDIRLTDNKAILQYNDTLLPIVQCQTPIRLERADQSSVTLAALCRASVEAVRKQNNTVKHHHCSKRRTKYKVGQSTEVRIRQTYLHFYTMLTRIAYPKGRRKRTTPWTPHTYQMLLVRWLAQWTTHHAPLHATMPHLTDLPAPKLLLSMSFPDITEHFLTEHRQLIKRSLHGTQRIHMQRTNNERLETISSAHHAKALGKVITLLTAQPTHHCDLSTLHSPTEGQITDHYRIHNLVTSFFTDWYRAPPSLDPAAETLTHTPMWWKELLHIPAGDHCQGLHPNSSIPMKLQEGLHKVCAIKASTTIQEEIRQTVDRLITFDEFSAAIDDLREGSAPGPSETTPNMLRAWNPVIRKFVYDHMLTIWQQRSCPDWFKDKLIKLAPKVAGSNDLNHMRPISLYEVLRKVWTTTIAKRIHLIWHTRQLLNPAQYGYRLDNGILMPLYNLLNKIEHAQQTDTPTIITFWDMRRAFDSIPRNLQRLAWQRLGVPSDLSEWFVALDEGGHAYVDTPHYQHNKHLKSHDIINKHGTPASIHSLDSHRDPLYFIPQRGIGQGESASSLMWVAVYDILLDWIDPTNKALHPATFSELCRPTHVNTPTPPDSTSPKVYALSNAYADDLATITTGPRAYSVQALQAEWISAFCAFTGLQLNMQKIVSVSLGKHAHTTPKFITVYDHNWQPTRCPIQTRPQGLTYLGLLLDHILVNDATEGYTVLYNKANAMLEHLLDQPGPPQAKIDFIRFKILPVILHTAQCTNWSLAQYRKLDVPFTRAYKTILVLPIHCATTLLYLPATSGGVGLPRLSDRVQVMKWRAFHRSTAVGLHPEQAINELLSRLPGLPHTTLPIFSIQIPPDWYPNRKLIARSLVQWLHQSGLELTRCLPETPLQEAVRARNHTSLSKVAKKIHLWYDQDIHDPDLPLLPLSYYVTDGSYKVETQSYFDILASEHSLRHTGTGAAGIVLQSSDTSRAAYPHTIRIITKQPQPGMSAYAWELIAQVVALKLTQFHEHTLIGYSDCEATIARMNTALSSFTNQLALTTAGILTTAAHVHSSISAPRRIQHIKAHPERDPTRLQNPTPLDTAIFLADAIAGNTSTKFNKTHINHIPHTLILEDILTEILPLQQWHLRATAAMDIPVLDLPWTYQHEAQLKMYLLKRDAYSTAPSNYWSDTATDFAAAVHPINSSTPNSYWHLARRTLLLYDWLGHGYNQTKRRATVASPALPYTPPPILCTHCGQQDVQSHVMLECNNPLLTPIRNAARTAQTTVARNLKQKYRTPLTQYFIEQLMYTCWAQPSTRTRRLWLGMWDTDTLQSLFPPAHDLHSPMALADRHKYRKISIQKLLAPILHAYNTMIRIPNSKHSPTHVHKYTKNNRAKHHLASLFPQHTNTLKAPSLTNIISHTEHNTFTYSDSAFSLTDVEVGIYK